MDFVTSGGLKAKPAYEARRRWRRITESGYSMWRYLGTPDGGDTGGPWMEISGDPERKYLGTPDGALTANSLCCGPQESVPHRSDHISPQKVSEMSSHAIGENSLYEKWVRIVRYCTLHIRGFMRYSISIIVVVVVVVVESYDHYAM
jgi:hypothetical protein